jgi:hypothetical protein
MYIECMQKRSSIPPQGDSPPGGDDHAGDDHPGDDLISAEEQHDNNDKGKNPAAVALGRLGGLKGGPARAKKLSAEQRSEVARRAAQARWSARSK